jgi:hypothetical protein
VPTGVASRLAVLDLDAKHAEVRDWWQANRDRMPPTRVHRTRSGGLHALFRYPEGLRNSAGRIAKGVDVRADGGYVIWWPAAGLPVVADSPIGLWPDWITAGIEPQSGQVVSVLSALSNVMPGGNGRQYALGALRHAVERVAAAGEGARNDTLNRETFSLARFIAEGALAPREVAAALAVAAHRGGLPAREVEKTLASALRAGGIG